MPSTSLPPEPDSSSQFPPDAARTARQHAHDVRNQLNGMELGLTLIGELAGEDADIASTLSQMRQNLAQVEASLRTLISRFAEPRPSAVSAGELVRIWEAGAAALLPAGQSVTWSPPDPSVMLWLDAAAVGALVTELILTICRRSKGRSLQVQFLRTEGQDPVMELREPQQELPLGNTFLEDLGVHFARHGGRLTYFKDEAFGEWVYRLSFPPAVPDQA